MPTESTPPIEFTVGAMVGRSRWDGVVYSYPLARLCLDERKLTLKMHRSIEIEHSAAIRIELKGKRFTWMRVLGVGDYPYIQIFLLIRTDQVATALLDAGFASTRAT